MLSEENQTQQKSIFMVIRPQISDPVNLTHTMTHKLLLANGFGLSMMII